VLNTLQNPLPVAILGAGPYGLTLAAHLRAKGVPFRIFGQPLHTWTTQMPEGTPLKSRGAACDLSTGGAPYTFAQFSLEAGLPCDEAKPVAMEDFIAYGREFARRFVPMLENEEIASVRRTDRMFRVSTASGEHFFARRVVMATSLALEPHIPAEFRHLPASRVTHPAHHRTGREFAGRDVTVLGSSASALHAAALLNEAGARVTLLSRERRLRLPAAEVAAARPRKISAATLTQVPPGFFRLLPPSVRRRLAYREFGPVGDAGLRTRLAGVPVLTGCRVHAIEPADGSGDTLRITLTDRKGRMQRTLTSHLIAGAGYRVDVNRLRFLSAELRECMQLDRNAVPVLSRTFETSVRGLHMIGAAAAPSFGPLLRSISGANFAAGRVSLHLQKTWLRERNTTETRNPVGFALSGHSEQLY
jgi:thioredoxin reductase